MQKIKDKSKKINVRYLQTIFNFVFVKLIFMMVFHNILNLLSLAFLPIGRQVIFCFF
jgi:hypothetical protein